MADLSKPFQLCNSLLGLSAPADSDVGQEGPGREAHSARTVGHFTWRVPCPHVLCSAGLSDIIRITDRVLSFLCQWIHRLGSLGAAAALLKCPSPGFPPPLCPLRNLLQFFWMDAHRILIQSQGGGEEALCLTESKTGLWLGCFFIGFGHFRDLEHGVNGTNREPCLGPVSELPSFRVCP